MPRSGYYAQRCKCGTDRRCHVSITIAGSTIGKIPRKKSRAVTLYICDDCLKNPKRKTRAGILEAILTAAEGCFE